MSDKAWGKLFGVLGSVALGFGWFAASFARGMKSKFTKPVDFTDLLPGVSPLFTLLVLVALILLIAYVVRAHACRKPGYIWSARIPLAFFEPAEVDVASKDGKLYQLILIVSFLVIPTIFLLVVINAFFQQSVFLEVDQASKLVTSGWRQLCCVDPLNGGAWIAGEYRFSTPEGPTYYPILQPWFYIIAAGATILYVFFALRAVARAPVPGGQVISVS